MFHMRSGMVDLAELSRRSEHGDVPTAPVAGAGTRTRGPVGRRWIRARQRDQGPRPARRTALTRGQRRYRDQGHDPPAGTAIPPESAQPDPSRDSPFIVGLGTPVLSCPLARQGDMRPAPVESMSSTDEG